MLYGIDISEWNGKNVPVSKYDFIILRAAIGNYDGSGCQMDELFSYNYNKCRNASHTDKYITNDEVNYELPERICIKH